MTELDLQSIFSRRIIIYLVQNFGLTINLILIIRNLRDNISLCKIYNYNYGSDHETIYMKFVIFFTPVSTTSQLFFKNAIWAKIYKQISLNNLKINVNLKNINEYKY